MPLLRNQTKPWLVLGFVLAFLLVLPPSLRGAELPLILTNLASIDAALKSHHRLAASIDLEAAVLFIDHDTLVLRDADRVQLFKVSQLPQRIQPGEVVHFHTGQSLFVRADYGVLVEPVPLVQYKTSPSKEESKQSLFLPRGRFPIRLAWVGPANNSLELFWEGPGISRQRVPDTLLFNSATNGLGVLFRCFEVSSNYFFPSRFDRLPFKSGFSSNFTADVIPRSREVEIDFQAQLEVTEQGNYSFQVEGGSQAELTISVSPPQIEPTGNRVEVQPPVTLATTAAGTNRSGWVFVEAQIHFIAERPGGWDLELVDGKRRIRGILVDPVGFSSSSRLPVKVTGFSVSSSLPINSQDFVMVIPGRQFVEPLAAKDTPSSSPTQVVRSIANLRKLTVAEASSGLPLEVSGVVTCIKADTGAIVLQDSTAGIEVHGFTAIASLFPLLGEVWKLSGHTSMAENGPVVVADAVTRLGVGLMPEPIRPGWDQLMNGSLDSQYVEIQGILTDIRRGTLGLLTSAGRVRLQVNASRADELKVFRNKLVRIRGCLFAVWYPLSHRIKSGELSFIDPVVTVDQEGVADPFSLPLRHVSELLGFEARNGQLERARVNAQLLHEWGGEYFLLEGTNGLRITSEARLGLDVGDVVDVVGYPISGGASLVVREPIVQKTDHRSLPPPTVLDLTRVLAKGYDSTLVQVQGVLMNTIEGDREDEFEIQAGFRTFVARLRSVDGVKPALEIGSRLQLTGVYSSLANNGVPALGIDTFELLLHSSSDIRVLSRPPWWTLNKLLSILGVFATVLLVAFIWIGQLRRRVALRTAEVEQQIQARQRLEQQQAMEQERARVAHDLHDELGAGLTEVGILGSLAKNNAIPADKKERYLNQLTEMSRQLVTTLDEIVWAINPKYDSVSSLGSYFCLYAQRFLELASVSCRLEIPESLPVVPLESKTRHSVFLAFKESLNNVVKHADAKEVRVEIKVEQNILRIVVSDDGKGFKLSDTVPGLDGLVSMKHRFSTLGGDCIISSSLGKGTVVTFILPLK